MLQLHRGDNNNRFWVTKQGEFVQCSWSGFGCKKVDATRQNLGWPYEPFHVPNKVKKHWSRHTPEGAALEAERNAKFAEYEKKYPKEVAEFKSIAIGVLPAGWEKALSIESELSSICDGILKVLGSKLIGSTSGGDSKGFYLKMKGDYYRYLAVFKTGDERKLIESELSSIYDGILKVLDSKHIGSASGGDSKVFYLKMKGDYCRYLAEFKTGDERKLVSNKTITIPAVEVEPPGYSYNPSSESHQDSLAQAVADEMQKIYTKELRPKPVPLIVEGGVIDEEDVEQDILNQR
ncbi:putative transketolase [Helianthus annuus]|uniref:Transketolase n=1 Tax=Helianthus annuus TaxID=4232 RepID=A0A9K3I762_HELAN|nr:putative transketolase [Helianthus annuus]